ncbi:hypothetical protein BIFBIF_01800 [Bifidobacterium bifidum ATCC 29521 = JCM 1255 = DSM 20456]|jgi:hypothetical protein|nr:hypothetical protein BIFBIF_01800 [Bifidobacterium bifidum ATCC 29521 = JCM 1255 = DSM 20456]
MNAPKTVQSQQQKALNTSDIAFGQPPEMQIDVPDPSDQPLEM